jgi:hypothetical protein
VVDARVVEWGCFESNYRRDTWVQILLCLGKGEKKGDCSSMVEQENFNLLVVGSSPISPIKRKKREKRSRKEDVRKKGGEEGWEKKKGKGGRGEVKRAGRQNDLGSEEQENV